MIHGIHANHAAELSDYSTAEFLQEFFESREVFYVVGLAVTNDNLGFTTNYGLDPLWYVLINTLVIPICIDDVVCTQSQTGIQAFTERPCETTVIGVPDHLIHTRFDGDFNRAICTSIIDDERFYYIYLFYFVRYITDGFWQRVFFIEVGICRINFIGGFDLFIATLFWEPHVKLIFQTKLYFTNIGVD